MDEYEEHTPDSCDEVKLRKKIGLKGFYGGKLVCGAE